jgi:hypothetical protein
VRVLGVDRSAGRVFEDRKAEIRDVGRKAQAEEEEARWDAAAVEGEVLSSHGRGIQGDDPFRPEGLARRLNDESGRAGVVRCDGASAPELDGRRTAERPAPTPDSLFCESYPYRLD